MGRIVGHHPNGATLYPDQRRHHAGGESCPELQHRIGVGEGGDQVPDVVDTKALLGDARAQKPLVGTGPGLGAPLEVGEVPLGQQDGVGIIFGHDIDHPVVHLDGKRANLFGPVAAQAAPFDHGRPAQPDVGVAGGDGDVGVVQAVPLQHLAGPGH